MALDFEDYKAALKTVLDHIDSEVWIIDYDCNIIESNSEKQDEVINNYRTDIETVKKEKRTVQRGPGRFVP
eukprot:Pgem_evm1s15069